MTASSRATPSHPEFARSHGLFLIRFSAIEEAATNLSESAASALEATRDIMGLARFCSDVQRTAVAMSLLASDYKHAQNAYGPIAEELHRDATRAVAAIHRIGTNAKALMNHIEQVSVLLTDIANSADISAGTGLEAVGGHSRLLDVGLRVAAGTGEGMS